MEEVYRCEINKEVNRNKGIQFKSFTLVAPNKKHQV